MARMVVYTDDLDGSDDAQEVVFAYKGESYAIDLGPANRERFDKTMAEFIEAARSYGALVQVEEKPKRSYARRTAGPVIPAGMKQSREQAQAVRDWARGQGLNVSDRGRIAADVQLAFDKAHAGSQEEVEAIINSQARPKPTARELAEQAAELLRSAPTAKPPKPALPTAEDLARIHEESKPKPPPANPFAPAQQLEISGREEMVAAVTSTPPQPGKEDSGNETPDEIAISTEGLNAWYESCGVNYRGLKHPQKLAAFKKAHPNQTVRFIKKEDAA